MARAAKWPCQPAPDPIVPTMRDGTLSPPGICSPQFPMLFTRNLVRPPAAAPCSQAIVRRSLSSKSGQLLGALNRSPEGVQQETSGRLLSRVHDSGSAASIIIGVPAVAANASTPKSPSNRTSFGATNGDKSVPQSSSCRVLVDEDSATNKSDSTKASFAQHVQIRHRSNSVSERSTAVHAGQKTVDSRIASMEESVKSFDRMLKEYQPVPEQDMMTILMHCESLALQLDEQRKSRKMLEDRTKQFDLLLRRERGEHEAWLVAFLKSMHSTLKELNHCIDQSVSHSSGLMKGKMDDTDDIMSDLIDRVDQLLIQKASEIDTAQADK